MAVWSSQYLLSMSFPVRHPFSFQLVINSILLGIYNTSGVRTNPLSSDSLRIRGLGLFAIAKCKDTDAMHHGCPS